MSGGQDSLDGLLGKIGYGSTRGKEDLRVKRILVLTAVVVVALAGASGAIASGLTCAHGTNCTPGNLGGGPQATGPQATGQGTLPFTGLDLAGTAAVGGLLLAGGLTLHRASRRRS